MATLMILWLGAIISVFTGSCVSPYLEASSAYVPSVVIQGMITDEPGPYVVIVSETIPIESQAISQTIVPRGLSGASVTITDDQGNSEQLSERSTGYYYTRTFQGVVGRSYYITVVTTDGDIYKSSVQKLLPVGDLDYSYQFKQVEDSIANQQITSKNGFEVFINSKLDPSQENRVWWRTIGTYHVQTYPQDRQTLTTVGRPPVAMWVADPPPCAHNGYHHVCTCCDCWINEFDQKPILSDPRFIYNGEINNLKIGFIQANRRTLYDKYVLEIQQFSVSEDVYNFWKMVQVQASNSSNLFQTPPPKTIGTLTAQSPSAKPVFGYFAASSIKRKIITFTAADVPYKIFPIDYATHSCLELYRNSTNQKPAFW